MFDMMSGVAVDKISPLVFEDEMAQKALMPMGMTSENVAEQFGISREKQDTMAFESHAKAAASNKAGWSQAEITPYKTNVEDKDGNETEVLVDRDDGFRGGLTMA